MLILATYNPNSVLRDVGTARMKMEERKPLRKPLRKYRDRGSNVLGRYFRQCPDSADGGRVDRRASNDGNTVFQHGHFRVLESLLDRQQLGSTSK